MLFEPSQKVVALKDKLLSFMDRHIYPNEARFYKENRRVRALEGLSCHRGTDAGDQHGQSSGG